MATRLWLDEQRERHRQHRNGDVAAQQQQEACHRGRVPEKLRIVHAGVIGEHQQPGDEPERAEQRRLPPRSHRPRGGEYRGGDARKRQEGKRSCRDDTVAADEADDIERQRRVIVGEKTWAPG